MSTHGATGTSAEWGRGTRLLDRFVIERRLGAGGMGIVYEALDEKRGERVALKTLGRVDSAAVYQIKREFRALADLVHPNLVRLHELFSDDAVGWFFTMARVDGVPFTAYARPSTADEATEGDADTVTASTILLRAPEIRRALAQLVRGVSAIHRAGKIHRDLKPANVLVAQGGRVTILDFGLATPAARDADQSVDLAGTPAYMAPEQLGPDGASPASDWYAVGVMLYEVLAGRLPFSGSTQEILAAKIAGQPPPPLTGLPDELARLGELATALQRKTPSERPTGDAILDQLGARTVEDEPPPPSAPATMFVGREAELARLKSAYDATRAGQTKVVWIEGTSGIGKSALVERFVDKLRFGGATSETVVVAGRCYERESVPFKALDAVVDALSRYLRRIDRVSAARLTPRDLDELCRVFPVLGRVPVFAEAERTRTAAADPEVVRRRAILALKEIFSRLADERPIVITIDDLQWGDVDSALVIAHLTSPPDPPPLLLVGTYRAEDVDRSPLLRALREQGEHEGRERAETISLAPLDEASAATLASQHGAGDEAWARRIAEESGGSPFFITELARSEGSSGAMTIAEVVTSRVKRLPVEAKRLLEVVAIAGVPIAKTAALRAAGLRDDAAVPLLRASSLLRASGEALEAYHDRIREVVSATVSPEDTRAVHGALADALSALSDAPPDALYTHCREAGRTADARRHAVEAARRAGQALAFDRAAELYQAAVDLTKDAGRDEVRPLLRELADALALSGRGDEAADAYLRAAEGAPDEEVLDLERHAATELVSRGDLDRGLALSDAVARRVGVWVPQSALLCMVLGSLGIVLILWRGIHPRQSGLGPRDGSLERRIDVLYALAGSLAMIETARSVYLFARFVRLITRNGVKSRLPLALWLGAGVAAGFARPGDARVASWLAQARALTRSEKHGTFLHGGTRPGSEAFVAFMDGRWRYARDAGLEAESLLEREAGKAWELQNARAFAGWAQFYLGELREYRERCLTYAREARARDNLFLLNAMVNTWGPIAHLARHDAETAAQAAKEAIHAWPGKRFQLQHSWHMLAYSVIELYSSEGPRLHERIEHDWPALQGSRILFSPLVRMQLLHLRGAACLAAAAARSADTVRRDLLRAADRHVARIAKLTVVGSPELATLVRAGVAHVRGDDDAARDLLAVTIEGLERGEMRAYAAAAKRQLGVLRGGHGGAALVEEADAYFTGEGVLKPERFAEMLAPGFT